MKTISFGTLCFFIATIIHVACWYMMPDPLWLIMAVGYLWLGVYCLVKYKR